ncbi:transposase, partial [Neisseria meningitidis]
MFGRHSFVDLNERNCMTYSGLNLNQDKAT